MAVDQMTSTDPMQTFYNEIHDKALDALWRRHQEDRPPGISYPPRLWKWSTIEPFARRAMDLVKPGPEAHRRVLTLNNPSTIGGATHTITGAVQIVLPGEIAPSHRHTAAAIRFIIQGTGTITMVDGEPCKMEPGDLVLTPGWSWHGHINQSDGPMIWMDSLDVPIVATLKAMRQENYPDELNPATKPVGDSEARYGAGYLQPVWEQPSTPISPLLRFPWERTQQALHELAKYDASPFDDVALRYTNPVTGKAVLPTLSCWIQLLRPGVHTQAHRHTTAAVYHVFRGRGSTIINGTQLDWEQGDFIALPPWAWHEHINRSSTEEAILFSTNDGPVFESLNLYTEEPYTENKGQQVVTGMYED